MAKATVPLFAGFLLSMLLYTNGFFIVDDDGTEEPDVDDDDDGTEEPEADDDDDGTEEPDVDDDDDGMEEPDVDDDDDAMEEPEDDERRTDTTGSSLGSDACDDCDPLCCVVTNGVPQCVLPPLPGDACTVNGCPCFLGTCQQGICLDFLGKK